MAHNRMPRVSALVSELATTLGVLSVELSVHQDSVHVSEDFMADAQSAGAEIRVERFPHIDMWRVSSDHGDVRFFATVAAADLPRFGYQLDATGAPVKIDRAA